MCVCTDVCDVYVGVCVYVSTCVCGDVCEVYVCVYTCMC